ncbi:MAG TPA: RDD family protein [Ferruginibacter sp.]|nr:RDD family protein [Ferruginibacter sp.]
MSIIQIATPFNIDIEFEIAEFHKRLLAYLIDFLLLIIYMYASIRLLFGEIRIGESSIGFAMLIVLIPSLLYTLLTELWMNGQTIGKKILKIKVVSLDGGEPTLGQYLLRWFLRFYEWGFIIVSIFYFNFIAGFLVLLMGGVATVVIIAITAKNQRLGDLAAGTVVVNTRSALTVADTVFMEINKTDYKVMFPQVMRLSDRDINTIKGVLTQAHKNNNYEMCQRVAMKVKDVLSINSDMHVDQFLEKLLEDYNYLATKE